MSATQSSFGREALKSRWTRSGRRAACASRRVVRHGLPRRFAPWIPGRPHQPLHAAPARWHGGAPSTSAGSRRRSSWRRAARGSGRAVARPRPRGQSCGRYGAGSTRRRHAQGPADRLDPEALAMLVDVTAHFGRSGSSSLAKNTLADFRISFARRSSKFSCRKRLISSRSSLVGRSGLKPGRPRPGAPASATSQSGCPNQRRHERSAGHCRAPNAHHARAAPSGYFLSLDMTAENLLSPGQHPGIEVPAKPGPAHHESGGIPSVGALARDGASCAVVVVVSGGGRRLGVGGFFGRGDDRADRLGWVGRRGR
jgi:hypothetical protein